jgi:hypothetical protein
MRVVPLWFVLLALIACGLFTVAFGWVVKDSLTESNAPVRSETWPSQSRTFLPWFFRR